MNTLGPMMQGHNVTHTMTHSVHHNYHDPRHTFGYNNQVHFQNGHNYGVMYGQ